ncbi:MAG: 6-hydroxynicotinate reductase [Gammaproteobacteria bacterium]|nr:6-hydroxynicotinate reductase [Gammaproteobacteria bacterium]
MTTDVEKNPKKDDAIRCNACPVLCRIKPGRTGACDRYGNSDGLLVRMDPLTLTERAAERQEKLVPFAEKAEDWDGDWLSSSDKFLTGIGAGTTYPDYKPAPFIVSQQHDDVDTVTVVTEGIFSYCNVVVKIDTDRFVGPETAAIYCDGEHIGHVTTAQYGSQMLSLGGVRHLTGGTRKEGVKTCEALLKLCDKEAIEVSIEGGATVVIQAGKAPVINGEPEKRMRVGCGSATIGIFAKQFQGLVDEVIVVDDHITGVLTEHQAGKYLDMPPSGIKIIGRKSTPGRYFQVSEPGTGWGGTEITDPQTIIKKIDKDIARPGLRVLMTTTTGEDSFYCELDDNLQIQVKEIPTELKTIVDRIGENCEPSLCTVLFMAGAGGSLRAGVTNNPINITRSVEARTTDVTMGGAPVFVYPGGGITVLVNVLDLPDKAFGYVPTPAIVAPIEFTLPIELYEQCGGHMDHVAELSDVVKNATADSRVEPWKENNPWPFRKKFE